MKFSSNKTTTFIGQEAIKFLKDTNAELYYGPRYDFDDFDFPEDFTLEVTANYWQGLMVSCPQDGNFGVLIKNQKGYWGTDNVDNYIIEVAV